MVELKNHWIKFGNQTKLNSLVVILWLTKQSNLMKAFQNNTELSRTPLAIQHFFLERASKFSMDGSGPTTGQSIGIKTDGWGKNFHLQIMTTMCWIETHQPQIKENNQHVIQPMKYGSIIHCQQRKRSNQCISVIFDPSLTIAIHTNGIKVSPIRWNFISVHVLDYSGSSKIVVRGKLTVKSSLLLSWRKCDWNILALQKLSYKK